jgi:tetratricopeptide (TPR) repeat protein
LATGPADEAAGAGEPIKLALADRRLAPEELELLFKYGTEAGYETEELAKVLLTEITALGLSPAQPPDGATDHARLTSGGTWAAAAPAPAVSPSLHSHAGRTASVVALVLVAVIILIQLPFTMPSDFDRSIDAALKNNRLIDPPNQNAFDLWFDEACASGRTIRVLAAAERIRGKLAPLGEEAFRKWYEASDPSVNWREVARVYRRLGTLSPDRTEYPVRRTYAEGQLAFERRDYSAALKGFSEVLAESPPRVLGHMNALALNGIGRVYEARGENQAAELFYDSCIDAEPGFAWAFVNRAKQRMRNHDWDEADRLLIRALNDAPRASTILIALGQVCESRGNSPGALLRYEQALEIDRNPKLVQTVASLRGKLGK